MLLYVTTVIYDGGSQIFFYLEHFQIICSVMDLLQKSIDVMNKKYLDGIFLS